ncbi:MAG: TMEM175 family protein [Candidatus Omnitrophota bacterium]
MHRDTKAGLKTSRIEALSDGIFAIAMTILVLSFEVVVQQPKPIDEQYLLSSLMALWPDFLHYVESFVILGAFWFQHHRQFHYIKSVDIVLLFLNIAGLMFIALIPFSTVLVSDYGHTRAASILFEVNLFIAGFVFFIHWVYASHKHRLVDESMDRATIKFYEKRNLIIPGVSLCAIALSAVRPRGGTILYFIVPLILLIWKRKETIETAD